MELYQAGPLQAVITPELADEAVQRTVVLLHGFGAPGTDLVGLHQAIRTEIPTRFVFLQAPHVLEGQSGPHAGRAWWHIDMMALHVARMTGQHEELAAQIPEGLAEAREAVGEALHALSTQRGMNWSKTVIGGFSQGAMLSCDYVLRADEKPEALIQLSGTVICESEWLPLIETKTGLRVFQSHSPDDQVLPYELAERHRANFTTRGVDVDFVAFRGGHGIGPDVLVRLSGFLARLGH